MTVNIKGNKKVQIGILYTSSIAGVFLGLLASIVNTRFLSPEDYGDVRFVQNYANLGATILYLSYFISGSRLLAITDSEKNKQSIRGTLICIQLATAILLAMFLVGCSFFCSGTLGLLFILALPLSFHLLLTNYITNVTQGDNRIDLLSAIKLLPYLIYVPFAYFIFKYFGATSEKMMLLQGGLYLLISLTITVLTKPIFSDLKKNYKLLVDENRQYGNKVYVGSLAMITTTYFAGITIGTFGENNAEVGFYTLALTVTSPLSMLPAIIGVTFFKKFASISKIPSKVMSTSVILTLITCIVFILLIKPIVVLLYSQQYMPVGNFAMWLAIGFSIHGLGDMFGRFLMAHGQGSQVRNSSIICGVVKLLGYVLLVYLWGVTGAILTTILADVIFCAIMVRGYVVFTKYCD